MGLKESGMCVKTESPKDKVVFSNWGNWSFGEKDIDIPSDFQKEIGLKAFMGWDGIIILDESVNIIDMCREYMVRAKKESCGRCFPCRLGTAEMADILERICQGLGSREDLDRLEYLANMVKNTSLCGIGQTTPRPILDALNNFRDQFRQAVDNGQKIPKGYYKAKVTAPCMNACPSHLDIPKYIEKIKEGKFEESLQVIHNDCPMAGTIGRVCVRPCEFNCRRTKMDEPIAIKALKRVADDVQHEEGKPPKFALPEVKEDKVAIIGAGPAGVSCAFYLGLRGYRSTIFESKSEAGGMAAWGIPEYRLPRDVLKREIEMVKKLGVEIRYNVTLGEDITHQDLLNEGYKAIFVGVGAPKSSKMRCEGEDAGYQCFMTGIEFLEQIADGKQPIEGKKLVVIGGGNVAMDCVRSSLRIGFQDVNLVYRRSEKEMPADHEEIEQAEEEGVKFHYLVQPISIKAQHGQVTGLECVRMELGKPDATGRRRPEPVEGSNFVIDCDAVIPAIGQTCVVDCLLPDEQGLEFTRWNTLVVDNITYQSGQPHIFSGGDCITGPNTLIQALAAGKKAAHYIDKYLNDGFCQPEEDDWLEKLINHLGVFDPKEKLPSSPKGGRPPIPKLDPETRIKSFQEVEGRLKVYQARLEANRCLRCYRIGLAAW